jgi:hypothetical protein
MALTTSQKISIFEIIDTPYTGNVDEMYGKFGLSALTYEVSDDGKVQLKVLDRLNSLTADEETKLITYIDRWETLDTQTWTINGGTNGINGFEYSPEVELEKVRRRVKNLIPVRHYWETVGQSAAGKSISISTIR